MLDNFQGFLHILERVLTALGDFFERDRNFSAILVDRAQITVFVQISDNRMAGEADTFVHRRQSQLPFQVVGQRLRLRKEIFERRLFENFGFTRPGGAVVQILIKALKIDIGIRIVRRRLGFRRRRSLNGDFRSRLWFCNAMIPLGGFAQRLVFGIGPVHLGFGG